MDPRFEKFQESRQAAVKLRIALEDFRRQDLEPRVRQTYESYLRQRIRPVLSALVEQEDLETLELVRTRGWLREVDPADFLKQARETGKNAAFVWLLRWKGELGFSGPDLSL